MRIRPSRAFDGCWVLALNNYQLIQSGYWHTLSVKQAAWMTSAACLIVLFHLVNLGPGDVSRRYGT